MKLAFMLLLTTPLQAAETGIASTFYDRVIACSPRRIDPYKTWGVAHRTHPCGTMLTITSQKGTVIAPVVDQGPHVKGRVVDLLPPVARVLGSNGLMRVKVER